MAKKRAAARKRAEVVHNFEQYFGDESEIANWQRLCRDVGIEDWDKLNSKTQCKKALQSVWVNIFDLLEANAVGKIPRRFPNQRALASYSINENKIYPKSKAKKHGPVKALLANFFGQ